VDRPDVTAPEAGTGRALGEPTTRAGAVTRAFALALALLLPAGVLFGMLWSRTGDDATAATEAGDGVSYLRPLGSLVAALADAQAIAANDGGADVEAVRRAVAEVDAADAASGAALGTTTRWSDLRERALRLADRSPSGPDGARSYGELAALAADLSVAVGDASGGLRDSQADTRSLTVAAAAELPALLEASGRYVEAVAAAAPTEEGVPPDVLGRELAARERVAGLAEAVDRSLARSVDVVSPAVDETLIARVGDFRAAAAAFVPPAAFAAAAESTGDTGRAQGQQQVLVRTGSELQRAVLVELAGRLDDRQDAVATTRAVAAGAGVLALAVGGWLLWNLLARRPDPGVDEPEELLLPDPQARVERDVVMVDARSLLGSGDDAEELVRVGRAVRRRREFEDDPA
jgi:hypothetical protein